MIKSLLLTACSLTSALAQINLAESFGETIFLTQTAQSASGVPLLQASDAIGFALLEYFGDGNVLQYTVTYQDLSGPPTLASVRGPATANEVSEIVQIDLTPALPATPSPNGTFSGLTVLDEDQHVNILSGLMYVSIRTEQNPNGELRGQINPNGRGIPDSTIVVNQTAVDLTTEQTNPRVNAALEGSGRINVQVTPTDPPVLLWGMEFEGLTGLNTPILGHFHGPAPLGANAGVQVEISGVPFTSPNVGQAEITSEQYDQIMQGQWYVNIHTQDNMGGEVRGQLVNFQEVIIEGNLGGGATSKSPSMLAMLLVIALTLSTTLS